MENDPNMRSLARYIAEQVRKAMQDPEWMAGYEEWKERKEKEE